MIKQLLVAFALLFTTTACIETPNYKTEPQVQKVYSSDKDVLMFILDASGSMSEKDKSGNVKMGAAKNAIRDIASQLDANKTNVGLIGFSGGCQSAKLLIEPSNNNLDLVINTSSAIVPSGKTPLAASIKKAGEVLKNIDKKIRIIVISDGVETCNGNPVQEAKRLKTLYGIDAKIYVIGYSVDARTQAQLESLAKAGSGSYYNAKDGAALGKIITNITDELDIKSDNWSGDVFKFKINFKSGSSKLGKSYDPQIKELVDYLGKTGYGVEIQGHSDSQGSKNGNQKLSKKRAQSVVNRLVKFGANESRVYSVGYGELAPIADNATKKGRYENRRVEAHFIKSGDMNIELINKANSANVVNVKNATSTSFIGYYKIQDPARSYAKYHGYVKVFANHIAKINEFNDNRSNGETEIYWDYNSKTVKFLIDASMQGKKNGGKMEGKLKGNTNKFNLSGKWNNGTRGNLTIDRIDLKKLERIKNGS